MNDAISDEDDVATASEWVRRCHERMTQLNPLLVHGDLLAIAEDMSRRAHWRRMAPEAAAEEAVDPPEARQPRPPE